MKLAMRIAAIALIIFGGVWMFQGLGYLPGSFMTGQMQWFYNGAGVAIVGLALLFWTLRRG